MATILSQPQCVHNYKAAYIVVCSTNMKKKKKSLTIDRPVQAHMYKFQGQKEITIDKPGSMSRTV